MSEEKPSVETNIPLNGLVADILEANAKSFASVTNTVMDRMTKDLAYANARLHIIEERIYELTIKPYVPNPREFWLALHITDVEIEEKIKSNPEVDFTNGYSNGQ